MDELKLDPEYRGRMGRALLWKRRLNRISLWLLMAVVIYLSTVVVSATVMGVTGRHSLNN